MNFLKKSLTKILLLVILIVYLLLLKGCETVKPWEKEFLSDPNMMFDENPIEMGIKRHYRGIREGAEGADGSQSGGCGCG